MAFFPNLSDLKPGCAALQNRSHRERRQINSFQENIFSEITRSGHTSLLIKFLYFILTQQADLPVPFSSMRIPLQTVLFF